MKSLILILMLSSFSFFDCKVGGNCEEILGEELVDQVHWADVGLTWWDEVTGVIWSSDGLKLICNSPDQGGGPIIKWNFWEAGKVYRIRSEVVWEFGYFEIFDGMVYSVYMSESRIYEFDYLVRDEINNLYLDSSGFRGQVLSLSVKEVIVKCD